MSIQIAKEAFLNRYNVPRTREVALSRAISAAAQHNALYIEGLNQVMRAPIRDFWADQLVEISDKYRAQQTINVYEADILALKERMNDRFGQHFRVNGDQTGFRISHSQKSISVFLKHMWCMDQIVAPPVCPVDAIILKIAGHANHPVRWTKVNSLDQHRNHVQLLSAAMARSGENHESIAHWEILNFIA